MTTPTTVNVRLQLRADTAANWAAANPTLLANEVGLETDTKKLKVGNGSTAWNSLAYFPSIVTGGTVLGNLEIGTTGTLTFEGSTADGFETTLGVINPTADRTINLPNQSGTVIVSGNATIVDADIAANAEIAVSKLADGAARQLLQTDAAGTGVEWTDNVDVPGTLDVTGAATFDGAVTIAGDLTVNGTTTNINTQNLVVEDKNVILGDVATPTDTTADGGGITLKGATDKTITWSDTTDSWEFNQPTITTGSNTAASFIPTSSTVPSNGVYLSGTNTVAVATNSTGRLFVDSAGKVGVGISSPSNNLDIAGAGTAGIRARTTDTSGAAVGRLIAAYEGGGGGTYSNVELRAGNNYSYLINTTNSPMLFGTNNTERLRIDSSGRLLVGTSATLNTGSGDATIQAVGLNPLACIYKADNANPAIQSFARDRNGAIVASGDGIGRIQFTGYDGSVYLRSAEIKAEVDGTPSANDMPGRLVFSTTADGASSPTERVRITSGGYFKASNDGSYASSTGATHEFIQTSATSSDVVARATSASYAGGAVYYAQVARAAANDYYFFIGSSSTSSDNEFVLYGDGNGKCDGAWTGGGADYAEYFEWADSNPDAEDRRGISVVLDGDKIRPAVAGEDPIGVISGNPSVVGDAAWNKWSGKYLRDEFGTYILEDYEVTDDDGNTVTQQRRKLNPAYDPDVEYTSREERPEWDCVGLMGKLRLRKGQPTGSRWIKMRDISDSVEEWLVR